MGILKKKAPEPPPAPVPAFVPEGQVRVWLDDEAKFIPAGERTFTLTFPDSGTWYHKAETEAGEWIYNR